MFEGLNGQCMLLWTPWHGLRLQWDLQSWLTVTLTLVLCVSVFEGGRGWLPVWGDPPDWRHCRNDTQLLRLEPPQPEQRGVTPPRLSEAVLDPCSDAPPTLVMTKLLFRESRSFWNGVGTPPPFRAERERAASHSWTESFKVTLPLRIHIELLVDTVLFELCCREAFHFSLFCMRERLISVQPWLKYLIGDLFFFL